MNTQLSHARAINSSIEGRLLAMNFVIHSGLVNTVIICELDMSCINSRQCNMRFGCLTVPAFLMAKIVQRHFKVDRICMECFGRKHFWI